MKKPSKVGLSKLMDARRKLSTFRRGGFSTKREKSASQQAIKKLLESNFTKAGFELNKFGALIKQSDAEARQKLANLKAESDKQSPAVLETLHGTAENLIANVAHLQAIPATVASPTYFLLDTATEISSNGGVTLVSKHIGPSPEFNSAQFHFDGDAADAGFGTPGSGEVSFGFLWQNPSHVSAVINIDGYIALNGLCSVISNGGFWGKGFSNLSISTSLIINELWNSPPTSPIEQPSQSQQALSLSCDSIGPFASSHIAFENLFRGFDLQFSQLVVPPKGTVGFEVVCTLFTWMNDGAAHGIFNDRGREAFSPGVLIAVLPSLTATRAAA